VIIDLPQTTTSVVAKRLVKLRDEGGVTALSRVLTLVVLTDTDGVEDAVSAANDASREHPCRIIVVAAPQDDSSTGLDAEIRVGGDAGASEVVILRPSAAIADHVDTLVIPLLLSDAPIVAWWTGEVPDSVAEHPIGRMAQSRITDTLNTADPRATLERLRENHHAADTDLAWTRTTIWRGLLAATLELPPYEPVHSAVVEGDADHPSLDLLAGWLAQFLRCPVEVVRVPDAQAVTRVVLSRRSGDIVIARPSGATATLDQPGQPTHHISLPVRPLRECLAEELRRLDPDVIYGEVLTKGLARLEGWEAR